MDISREGADRVGSSDHVGSPDGNSKHGWSGEPGAERSSALCSDSKTILIIDRRVLFRDCLARCLSSTPDNYNVLTFGSVAEWAENQADHPPVSVVLLSIQGRRYKEFELEQSLSLFSRAEPAIPVILLSEVEDVDQILDALDSGVRGYIPTSVTLDIAVEAMRLVKAGGIFVPASSLRSTRRSTGQPEPASSRNCLFTARQAAVVDALRQGKANKMIAYELNMRESTVKVHVRNIMKKLNAKNRTEVAFLTNRYFATGQDAGAEW